MKYTVNKLARLSGISVRTLHYYDELNLLKPARIEQNGYRIYEESDLLKLQQILFFKELDFPLLEIKKILENPHFDTNKALHDQRRLIEIKKARLTHLIKTIDKTINTLRKKTTMSDKELYSGLSKEEQKKYEQEAKERWGNTDAYKQSVERVNKMSKKEMAKIQEGSHKLLLNIVMNMNKGADSGEIQSLIDTHYNNLRSFYEPNPEIYRGLASMYVDDPRFTAYYEKYASGLAKFMHDAMNIYCDAQK